MGNTLRLDFGGFEDLLSELEAIGGDVKSVVDRALREAAVEVQTATILAVKAPNLPALGKYSTGDTAASIIHWPPVQWDGDTGWVSVGFDYSKPGAGGYLITGTPRMSPDRKLNKIYKGKKFMSQVQRGMLEKIWDEMLVQIEKR